MCWKNWIYRLRPEWLVKINDWLRVCREKLRLFERGRQLEQLATVGSFKAWELSVEIKWKLSKKMQKDARTLTTSNDLSLFPSHSSGWDLFLWTWSRSRWRQCEGYWLTVWRGVILWSAITRRWRKRTKDWDESSNASPQSKTHTLTHTCTYKFLKAGQCWRMISTSAKVNELNQFVFWEIVQIVAFTAGWK